MNELRVDRKKDPVRRMVRTLTPAEVTAWLIEYHKLPEGSRQIVESNLRDQFKWHRLQGRLDRHPWLAVIAKLLGLRQSVKALEKAKEE